MDPTVGFKKKQMSGMETAEMHFFKEVAKYSMMADH
jgi:hypothetical protein